MRMLSWSRKLWRRRSGPRVNRSRDARCGVVIATGCTFPLSAKQQQQRTQKMGKQTKSLQMKLKLDAVGTDAWSLFV